MRFIRSLPLPLALVALSACDSGPDVTPASTFPDPVTNQWQLVGHVRAGTEPVGGALMRVDVSDGFTVDPQTQAAANGDARFFRTTTTDAAGGYRFSFAPFVYDLSIAHASDLYVFHELMMRVFDPPLAVDAPVTGFEARVVPSTSPPPVAGHAIAYFVSGTDARALVPIASAAGAFDVTFGQFDSTVTLHAVEYVAASGLAAAVAEGKVDVHVRDGVFASPVLAMTPVTAIAAATFEATPPPGYELAPLEMEMDFGLRTSAVPLPLTHIVLGQILNFGVATDARYFVHARATHGGAISSSGRNLVNPFDKNTLVLPPPISTEAPIEDTATPVGEGATPAPVVLPVGGTLSVRITTGIVEHALVPQTGRGTTFHLVTGERTTTLPDATALGLASPRGLYVWTVQSFPTLLFTDRLDGDDGRVATPSWTSAPRVIVVP